MMMKKEKYREGKSKTMHIQYTEWLVFIILFIIIIEGIFDKLQRYGLTFYNSLFARE